MIAFGKPLILIVLHFINNYYEIDLYSLTFIPQTDILAWRGQSVPFA